MQMRNAGFGSSNEKVRSEELEFAKHQEVRAVVCWLLNLSVSCLSLGRGHDGLVNCVRTSMSKSVSISKRFVAANVIYSHKFAGHDALVSAFVATYEYSPAIFSVVGISRNR